MLTGVFGSIIDVLFTLIGFAFCITGALASAKWVWNRMYPEYPKIVGGSEYPAIQMTVPNSTIYVVYCITCRANLGHATRPTDMECARCIGGKTP